MARLEKQVMGVCTAEMEVIDKETGAHNKTVNLYHELNADYKKELMQILSVDAVKSQ